MRHDSTGQLRWETRSKVTELRLEFFEYRHIPNQRYLHLSAVRVRVLLSRDHTTHCGEHLNGIEGSFDWEKTIIDFALPLHLHPRVECRDACTNKNGFEVKSERVSGVWRMVGQHVIVVDCLSRKLRW